LGSTLVQRFQPVSPLGSKFEFSLFEPGASHFHTCVHHGCVKIGASQPLM
jgi:hypothetical protein